MKVLIKDNNEIIEVKKVYDETYTNCYYQDINNQIYSYNEIIIVEPDKKYNICILNKNNVQPNILHFQGTSKQRYQEGNLFEYCINNTSVDIVKPSELTFITIYTNKDQCYLYEQSKIFDFEIINAGEGFNPIEWNMTYKIELLISALEKVNTKYVLITDGYDVLVQTLDNIIPKFESFNTKILFNATKNNFPEVHIDKIYARDARGPFRFFNAGCCIGYTKDVLDFYKESFKIKDIIKNPFGSEQFILRHVFAKYSEQLTNNYTPSYVEIDYECKIFQSFGNTMLIKQNEAFNDELNIFNVL